MKVFKLIIGSILLSGILFSCKAESEEYEVGLNESIYHDDFEYVVTDYKIIPVDEYINRYLIQFKVINNAKLVEHSWNNSIAYIVDSKGNIYYNSIQLQKIRNDKYPFGWEQEYHTHAQSEKIITLIFELPKKVTKPYLKLTGKFLMGDFFDLNKFKKMKVRLF